MTGDNDDDNDDEDDHDDNDENHHHDNDDNDDSSVILRGQDINLMQQGDVTQHILNTCERPVSPQH